MGEQSHGSSFKPTWSVVTAKQFCVSENDVFERPVSSSVCKKKSRRRLDSAARPARGEKLPMYAVFSCSRRALRQRTTSN